MSRTDSVTLMSNSTSNESDLLTLAFSLCANPGAYALLLGAGVPAPSGIPTAWGVFEDLVARTADFQLGVISAVSGVVNGVRSC